MEVIDGIQGKAWFRQERRCSSSFDPHLGRNRPVWPRLAADGDDQDTTDQPFLANDRQPIHQYTTVNVPNFLCVSKAYLKKEMWFAPVFVLRFAVWNLGEWFHCRLWPADPDFHAACGGWLYHGLPPIESVDWMFHGCHLPWIDWIARNVGMDQYLLIPFLGGWASIYQLFWCELQGYKVLTHCHVVTNSIAFSSIVCVTQLNLA